MINYDILHKSTIFYEQSGFKRIETPWTVTPAIIDITKPKFAADFEINGKNKSLVGSAEQGFLYLYLKGFLPKGRFQSISPCFRDENFDTWHTKYFIKNELIITDEVKDVSIIIAEALGFFGQFIEQNKLSVVKKKDEKFNCDSYDIEYRGIELGSYGIREGEFLTWMYGTGVAEPRLSMVLNKYKNGIS